MRCLAQMLNCDGALAIKLWGDVFVQILKMSKLLPVIRRKCNFPAGNK